MAACSRFTKIFFIVLCLQLASCTYYDSGFQRLVSQADTQPDSSAIVGMWHRKSGPETSGQVHSSLLFKRDGTGVSDFYHTDMLVRRDQQKTFRWSYQGGGVWLTEGNDLNGALWRRSGNTLLMEGNDVRQKAHFVWERVQQ